MLMSKESRALIPRWENGIENILSWRQVGLFFNNGFLALSEVYAMRETKFSQQDLRLRILRCTDKNGIIIAHKRALGCLHLRRLPMTVSQANQTTAEPANYIV